MLELLLHQADDILEVTFGELHATIPWTEVAPDATMGQRIYDDAQAYGRDLFDKTFRHEQMRTLLTNLPANERLLLVADDPLVASIPWEYLRDSNNKLLASRLNLVRGLPNERRRAAFEFSAPLEIVAVPVSPIDEPVILDVEREWKNLIKAVTETSPPQALTLKRVRPPTRSKVERNLGRRCTSIVHFMGHSASHDGKAFLAFEDARARRHLVDAADFVDSLNARVFLVVLNSCLSAVVAHTEFGNIAHLLVSRGVPYALGMQFILPDAAALVLSKAFYDFLLQEQTVEEAVMHTRRALEEPGKLPGLDSAWLAGIPVLYTGLQAPAPPIELPAGQPEIRPDPAQLEQACDLAALPVAQYFVGRSEQVSEVVGILLNPHQRGFVLLHGLGGIGKTALARALAERLSYHYSDHVLAYSFETFARFDANNRRVVDETFADRFITRLACFYGLDPKDANLYPTRVALQQAIVQHRAHVRSLLVLDNIETLFDALEHSPVAQSLVTFVARLNEGEGAVLLTSRNFPPSDWGEYQLVSLAGLAEEAGAALFLALLPADRAHLAPPAARKALSRGVDGHPLSIQLLAGQFADMTATNLDTFLQRIEVELAAAEQTTPTSMEDPLRQKTLYACLDYSIRRLTTEQRKVLDATSLFQAPFPPDFPLHLFEDEEQTATHLQTLVRLSLLEISVRSRTFQEGELVLLELHPMVRWYIEHDQPELAAALREQYGEIYVSLASQAFEYYDWNARLRYLLNQSLPDCEAALQSLAPVRRSTLAYHLAQLYHRLGQNRRALALYELSLEIDQELGDLRGVRNIAVTQTAMAQLLVQQGKPQEALTLYEQSLSTLQDLGEVREVAITQHAMADLQARQGKFQEALALYKQVLQTQQMLGDIQQVAVAQHAMANVLVQQGQLQEALALYAQAQHARQEVGDMREVAVTQCAIADVLLQQGKPQEALALFEQALSIQQEVGDREAAAKTQMAIAGVLLQQGKLQEALALYEQAQRTHREVGDVREVAVTQCNMANVLVQQGKPQEALALYERALPTYQALGDVREVATTQCLMAKVLRQQGKLQEAVALCDQALPTYQALGDPGGLAGAQFVKAGLLVLQGDLQEALTLYEHALRTDQELGRIGDVAVTQTAMAKVLVQQGRSQEALVLYEQALRTCQELGNVREAAVTQHAMAYVLKQQGQLQQALALYAQALHACQEMGEVQIMAVFKHAMADVLVQQGKSQDALVLYEQALRALQEIGDRREVAVTQTAIADVLVQQGKLQEAAVLYEQALDTCREIGDAQEIATIQANFGKLLFLQGEYQRSLAMIWQAYEIFNQNRFPLDVQSVQQLLLSFKKETPASVQFDQIWTQTIDEPQPEWLLQG